MKRAFAGIPAFILGLLFFTVIAEAAPIVFTQGPCARDQLPCLTFYAHSPVPIIRTIAFNAPRAGVAQVTFNGTLSCSSASDVETYVDLAAQIVTPSATVARVNAPGGARHTVVLDRVWSVTTQSPTLEINLASTRTIAFPHRGRKQLNFLITKLRMDPFTSCRVHDAVFTVLYLS